MQYEIEIQGLEELQRAFSRAPEVTLSQVRQATDRTLIDHQGTAKNLAPVDHNRLRQGIVVEPAQVMGSVVEGKVRATAKYSLFQERGTGVYGPTGQPIRPRRKKMLAWKKNGQWIFARQVKGSRPRHFFKGAVEQNRDSTNRHYERALEEIARQLSR